MRRRVRDGWSFRATIRAYLPELIYGANDGIVTTLAVVSGVTGADLSSRVIPILGFANLFADGFSMGASDVLSERSEPGPEARPSLREASRHGVATFAGFIGAGIVPLLAYLLPCFEGVRFPIACGLAGAGAVLDRSRPLPLHGPGVATRRGQDAGARGAGRRGGVRRRRRRLGAGRRARRRPVGNA